MGNETKNLTPKYRWVFPLIIGLTVFLILLATVNDIGLTWDEPAYIAASNSYLKWFDKAFTNPSSAFTSHEIVNAWSINNEHPPLDKIWTGLWWRITKNLTNDLVAHRIGNMLLVSILASLLFLLIAEKYGWIAGIASIASLLTMPRFFFHAHLSALDVPAAFSVFVVTFIFWKISEKKGWAWDLLLGLAWGLALATKINAVFIPFTLFIWSLIFKRNIRFFLRMIIMGFTAIPVFFAVWPWLYTNTFENLIKYIKFVTVDHWQIGQFYLGKFYLPPPWHFGFVMIWAVIPLGITALYLLGTVVNFKGKKDSGLGWLMMLSALTPILAIALSKSVVYDNDRMYMVSFPFLAGLAGTGFGWLFQKIFLWSTQWRSRVLKYFALTAVVLILFSSQLVTMIRLYPHYLSYYSEGVGGVAGAKKLGFETTYWCETYKLAIPILNQQAKINDTIWVDPWSHDVLIYFQTQGWLRQDLKFIAPNTVGSILGPNAPSAIQIPLNSADWYVFQYRQSTLTYLQHKDPIYKTVKQKNEVFDYSFDGVPIFSLYHSQN